jgi:hypothetical protein
MYERLFSEQIILFTPNYLQTTLVIEELYFLGYIAVQSDESQPTFQKNFSPPFSGSKNKPSKKQREIRLQAEPTEDEGYIFLQNVG